MRKHKTARGFVLGFLVCALLTCGVSYADDIYENIAVLMGKMNIYFGDTPIAVDNMVYNGTTYVPLRSYSEQLGLVVDYDAATDKVTIKNKSEAQLMSKEIAFLVNGQPVRVDFFTQMVNWYLMNSAPGAMTSEAYADFKDFVREEVVGMEVTEQYTESLGIMLSGTDLNAINNKIEIYANNYGGMDAFVELLRQNGVSYETYYEIQKNYMLREKLTDIMSDSITEDEINAYYDAYKDTYYKKEKATAKQILMSTIDDAGYALSPSVKAQKKAQMLDIYDDIINGVAKFDDMMFTYSEDPGLKAYPNGYSFARGEMLKAFEDKAFSMNAGEMSNVFESEQGYHIILVTDRSVVYEPLENVKESIVNTLRNDSYYKIVQPQISEAYVLLNTDVYNSL